MSKDKHKIILVEDSSELGYLLSEYLSMKNFEISWFINGTSALKNLETIKYDLAILDITMPDMDGFSLAEQMKERFPDLPFLFLTARSLKVDVLKGFYLGAVDYLKKPIDEEELVIRIENLLARIKSENRIEEKVYDFRLGQYKFNSLNQELSHGDEEYHLTTKESELLYYLVINKNNLCSHKDILIKLWGANDYFNKKSLNVFITHLRKYLEKDANISIDNIHGKGFILRL
ncbi:response regulator transcription factor [uncultured Maribacter sp.]|uniref:response regulator transcription factor n=1 Tax=uncultured Maribacter sp. TaxID=431308 RepID=UPI0030DC6116|tara:strand:- start:836 stop:1531 length:696 start_codon:yes stop_codon:yes gene_type:complete